MLCGGKRKRGGWLPWLLLVAVTVGGVGYFFMTDTKEGRRLLRQMKRTGRECADACGDLTDEFKDAVTGIMS